MKALIAPTASLAMALVGCPATAQDPESGDGDGPRIEASAAIGRDVVPPDVVDITAVQDRIETVARGGVRIGYELGDTLIDLGAGFEVFPEESLYYRYRLETGVLQEIALTADRDWRLRLGASYEYVLGDEGRIYDRPRADVQLVRRWSPTNTTIGRVRYGYRNQTERRFVGYDQSEWLLELRHAWRPGNGATYLSISALGDFHDADDDRFSYDGYGVRLIGRTPLGERSIGRGTFALIQRDYENPFSGLYPFAREDTDVQATLGVEYLLDSGIALFAEGGYRDNASNIPTRDYSGFIGQLGVRYVPD